MKAEINIWFQNTADERQTKLATLEYEPKEGRIPVWGLPDNQIRLPDGSTVQVTSGWSPDSNMISIIVFREGKIIGHAGSCWHLGDPYLGVQVENVGFIHLYCKRQRKTPNEFSETPSS